MSASLPVVEHYLATYPAEIARHVDRLPPDDAVALTGALSDATAATLLTHLAPALAARVLAGLSDDKGPDVLAEMPIDAAAALLRRLAPPDRELVLERVPVTLAHRLGTLLTHGHATAGGVMDPDVLTVPLSATVADARALLEATPDHLYYYLYVVDAEQRLAGVFDLAELMQAPPDLPIEALLTTAVTWLHADAPLESVFAHPGWRTLDALPVVDVDRHFLGVLRHRTMRQLREHETPTGDDRAVRTVMALGEIYWLGLCGLLQGIASTATDTAAQGEAS